MVVVLLGDVENELIARAAADDLSDILDLDSALALVVLEVVDCPRGDHEDSLLLRPLPVDLFDDVAEDDLLIVRVARDQKLEHGRLSRRRAWRAESVRTSRGCASRGRGACTCVQTLTLTS